MVCGWQSVAERRWGEWGDRLSIWGKYLTDFGRLINLDHMRQTDLG